MGEPLPDDPALLRAIFDDASQFLGRIAEPLAALSRFRLAYQRAITDPGTARDEASYLAGLDRETRQAMDGLDAQLPMLLDRYLTADERAAVTDAHARMVARSQVGDDYRAKGMSAVEFDRLVPRGDHALTVLAAAVRRLYRDVAAKLEVTPQLAARTPGDNLTSTQKNILIAACELKAFDLEAARPREEIAARAGVGPATNRNVRQAMAGLIAREMMIAKRGPGGGHWITPAGRSIINK